MGDDEAASVVKGGRPCRRRRPNSAPRTPRRRRHLLAAVLPVILVMPALFAVPHARPVDAAWIPAFAGTTVGNVPGYAVRTIIPAFAGMTASTPAHDGSGAPARGAGEFRWTPAVAKARIVARIGHPPGRGMFLLAAPGLRDPRFARTVVLLLEYDGSGALGLVINRPTEASLDDVLVAPLPNSEGHAVFAGGPVELRRMIALLRSRAPVDGAERLFGDVHASGSMDTLRRALSLDGYAADVHAYAGYAGWAPGQLDAEIARGDWIVTPADAESIFDTPPGDIWRNLMRRNAGRWVRAGDARPA